MIKPIAELSDRVKRNRKAGAKKWDKWALAYKKEMPEYAEWWAETYAFMGDTVEKDLLMIPTLNAWRSAGGSGQRVYLWVALDRADGEIRLFTQVPKEFARVVFAQSLPPREGMSVSHTRIGKALAKGMKPGQKRKLTLREIGS